MQLPPDIENPLQGCAFPMAGREHVAPVKLLEHEQVVKLTRVSSLLSVNGATVCAAIERWENVDTSPMHLPCDGPPQTMPLPPNPEKSALRHGRQWGMLLVPPAATGYTLLGLSQTVHLPVLLLACVVQFPTVPSGDNVGVELNPLSQVSHSRPLA